LEFVALVLEVGNILGVEIVHRTKSLYMRSGSVGQVGGRFPVRWHLQSAFRDISVQQEGRYKWSLALAFLKSLGLDCSC
jgi:hypothetical protein